VRVMVSAITWCVLIAPTDTGKQDLQKNGFRRESVWKVKCDEDLATLAVDDGANCARLCFGASPVA
jgi:hypothetical protein